MSSSGDNAPRPSQVRFSAILLLTVWLPAFAFGIGGLDHLGLLWVFASSACALALALLRRSVLIGIAIPASVMIIIGGFGIAAWFSQRPAFHTMGLPGHEFFNLDPETRCYRETGGCKVTGAEWIYELPHNTGLRLMCMLFGPPRHTYQGPYPTTAEVLQLTKDAPALPVQAFLDGKLLVAGRPLELGREKVAYLLSDFGNREAANPEEDFTTEVKAVLVKQRCLAIRVTTRRDKEAAAVESDGIYLFEVEGIQPFARLILHGSAPRLPQLLLSRK